MSDRVTSELLREKRVIFEQELDKQVKVSTPQACEFQSAFSFSVVMQIEN
jgi:hypothetical protein